MTRPPGGRVPQVTRKRSKKTPPITFRAAVFWTCFLVALPWSAILYIGLGLRPHSLSSLLIEADFLGGIRQPALAAPLVVTPIVVAIVLLRPARRSLAYKVGSALLVSGALLQVVPIIDTGHRALISVGDAQFSIPWRYEPSPTSGFNVEVFGPELATSRSAIGSGRRDGIHIDVTPS
ncbi:MAG: hypothetical protein AAF763_00840 [Pseudomonadota bacterium]